MDPRPLEIERRFHAYVLMVVIVLPRVLFHGTLSDGAAILIVWSAIGVGLMRRATSLVPRAIVWRPRETRLRRWGDALLERLAHAPVGYGLRSTIPWAPHLLDAGPKSSERVDTGIPRDLGEDLPARGSCAIQS
jgi:hypothetical protein